MAAGTGLGADEKRERWSGRGIGVWRCGRQEGSALLELLAAMAVGQEPVVADVHEAAREEMQEEAADELEGVEAQRVIRR